MHGRGRLHKVEVQGFYVGLVIVKYDASSWKRIWTDTRSEADVLSCQGPKPQKLGECTPFASSVLLIKCLLQIVRPMIGLLSYLAISKRNQRAYRPFLTLPPSLPPSLSGETLQSAESERKELKREVEVEM